MKLLLREYLGALRERSELERLLPDMLSEIGMTILTHAGQGSRQYGVDVLALGPDPEDTALQAVYLITIKAGDVGRTDWDSSPQSVRQSLNDIVDVYIGSHLPPEHAEKRRVVVLALGGEVVEAVRPSLSGYVTSMLRGKPELSFQEWNGDHLAGVILSGVLDDSVFDADMRRQLRKSVAFVDEAEICARHFTSLCGQLQRGAASTRGGERRNQLRALRQLNLALFSVYVGARDAGNLEGAFRASEIALLYAWNIAKACIETRSKAAERVVGAALSAANLHLNILDDYVRTHIRPVAKIMDGLATMVPSRSALDVNLALFDLLGRVALLGHWKFQEQYRRFAAGADYGSEAERTELRDIADMLISIIETNPGLLNPITDRQSTPIMLTLAFLMVCGRDAAVSHWMRNCANAVVIAYRNDMQYPIASSLYGDLARHPLGADGYKVSVTEASVLHTVLAIELARLDEAATLAELRTFMQDDLSHCTHQLWFPNGSSEEYLWTNTAIHGRALVGLDLGTNPAELLSNLEAELGHERVFHELSCTGPGLWCIALTAFRHYGLPVPPSLYPLMSTALEALSDAELIIGDTANAEKGESSTNT